MTTVRLSLEEVRVQSFIYGFTNPEVAGQFQTCLLFDPLDDCEAKFPPHSRHSICFEIDDDFWSRG
jgi:hypothetical protein